MLGVRVSNNFFSEVAGDLLGVRISGAEVSEKIGAQGGESKVGLRWRREAEGGGSRGSGDGAGEEEELGPGCGGRHEEALLV